jgi:sugar lactone lactonase YvrE
MADRVSGRPLALLTSEAVYPESPRWREGLLWFSDVHDYAVKTVDADGRVSVVTKVPGRPAGSGFLPDGRLLIAGALDRMLYVWDGDRLSQFVDLAPLSRGLLNDMVVDHLGRAYIGDTGFNLMAGESARPGQLILVDTTAPGSPGIRVVADDVEFPNGASISQDGRQLWLSESAANRVSRFDVSPDGSLQRTTTFPVPDFPDGICVDAHDDIWVALLRIGEFHHITTDGATDEIVAAPGQLAVACTLGGRGRSTLYLCSADTSMAELSRGRSAGLIHTMPVHQPGVGFP